MLVGCMCLPQGVLPDPSWLLSLTCTEGPFSALPGMLEAHTPGNTGSIIFLLISSLFSISVALIVKISLVCQHIADPLPPK